MCLFKYERWLLNQILCPDYFLVLGSRGTRSLSAEDRLRSVRTQFIERVSDPVLDKLLDELLRQRVVSDEEMEAARTKSRADKAREVIDMVRRKGSKASSKLISIFNDRDPYLSQQLHLA